MEQSYTFYYYQLSQPYFILSQKMYAPKYLLLFVYLLTLSTQLEQISVIYHYGAANTTENIFTNYYQYTEASYGPKPPNTSWNLSLPKDPQLCKLTQEKYIKNSEQTTRMRRAILVARGNCTFTQKTKNAQKLGYDLVIIYESANVPILPTTTGNDSQITIPTIMISYTNGELMRILLPSCPRGVEIAIGWQQSQKYYKLPSIGFNIDDRRSLSYLSEFYYHYYFEQFEPLMDYSFKLLYHSLQKCENRSCVPNDKCIFSGAQLLCYNNIQLHNGKTVLRQQIRSYITYQQVGRRLWWKYVVLFNQNACFLNQNIDECFEANLKELKISTKTINLITQLTNNMTKAHFWEFKILYSKIDVVELAHKGISLQQKSLIDKTLLEICHSDAKKPIAICKKITHQDLSFTIKDYNPINYEFVQPAGRSNTTVTQLIRIRLSQIVLSSLDEVLIILSRCPGVAQWSFKACQPFEYQKHTGKVQLTGKFGHWNKSELTDDSMELYSIQKYAGNIHVMSLKKKEIIQQNITLLLKLPTSYRTYLNIVSKKSEVKVLQTGDVELGYLAQNNKLYELLFEDVTNPLLHSFSIKIEAHFSNIQTSLFATINRQKSFSTYAEVADPFYYYYYFPAIIFNNNSRSWNSITCIGSTVINCSLFLSLNFKTSTRNELFKISFARHNQGLIYSIQTYQPFYDSSSHMFERNISGVYVQLLKMRTFGDHSFGNYMDSSIVLSTGTLTNNIEVSFQLCLEDYLCQIKSINEWEQLQKNNKTRALKHYSTKTSAKNTFDTYLSTKYYNNVEHLSLSNPANSFRRFLKVDQLNVYIVYRQKTYLKNETIRPKLLLPPHWRWDVIVPTANQVYSHSESCEFNIQKTTLSTPRRIILIHKKIDEHIRIYSRIIQQDFHSLDFKTYIPQTNNTLLNSIFKNYFYLDHPTGTQKAFKIQIIVEDKLKRVVDEDASYYSIGWSNHPVSSYSTSSAKEIQLQEDEDRHVFAYTEKYTKAMSKYIIKSSSNVIILHFNAQLSIFQDKIVLCTSEECYNHSHFKVWKDLKTNQLVTGLKVNSKIKSGFNILVLDYKIGDMSGGGSNLTQKNYEQLPIEVRIQTKVVQNLIEIKQVKDYEHVQQYEDTRVKQKAGSQQAADVDQKPIKANITQKDIEQVVKQQVQSKQREQQKVKPSNKTSSNQKPKEEQIVQNKTNASESTKGERQINKSENKTEQKQKQKQKQKQAAKEQPPSKEEIHKEQNAAIKQNSQEQDHKDKAAQQAKQSQQSTTEYQSTQQNNKQSDNTEQNKNTPIPKQPADTNSKKQTPKQQTATINKKQTLPLQKQIDSIAQPQFPTNPQSQIQVLNQKEQAIEFAIILVSLLIICILLFLALLLFKLIRIISRNKLDIHQLYPPHNDIVSSDSVIHEDK